MIYTDTQYDIGPYDAYWIKEKPWTFRILPELGLELNERNVSDVKNLIDRCIEDPSFAKGRDKARAETWVHMGEGTKRTVDFIMEKYNEVIIKDSKKKGLDQSVRNKKFKFAPKKGA